MSRRVGSAGLIMLASRLETVAPGLFRWAAFSPEHKVELSSHAVLVNGGIYCFDPIPLGDDKFRRLSSLGKPAAIILTNDNHERDAARWQERWQVPIVASTEAVLSIKTVDRFPLDCFEWEGWKLHRLDGGGGGELAFRHPAASLVVLGDAVVNLPGRGLELLPEKYCRDRKQMERGLAGMVENPFEAAVMAHGMPLTVGASLEIARLLP